MKENTGLRKLQQEQEATTRSSLALSLSPSFHFATWKLQQEARSRSLSHQPVPRKVIKEWPKMVGPRKSLLVLSLMDKFSFEWICSIALISDSHSKFLAIAVEAAKKAGEVNLIRNPVIPYSCFFIFLHQFAQFKNPKIFLFAAYP